MKFIIKPIILENNIITRPIFKLDEIEDNNNKAAKFLDEFKIPADVLNSFKIKDTLCPKIWDKMKLKPEIAKTIKKIAEDFFKLLEIPNGKLIDILIVGSIANYNWSEFSDVDIHIVVDFSKLKDNQDFIKKHFDAEKNLWNKKHNITIANHDTEIYVQDLNEKLSSAGVYSVKTNSWIKKPNPKTFNIDKPLIKRKVKKFFDKLKSIKKDYDNKKFNNVIKKIDLVKTQIKKMRQAGLESGGEYSTENIIFKILRRTDFLDIIDNIKNKAYDQETSLNESVNQDKQLTPEYIVKRIPFLKTFNNFSNDKAVFFQKVIYNSNVKMKIGDDIATFSQLNTSSEFTYFFERMNNDRLRYSFSVSNEFHPTKPDGMDNLMFRVFIMALNMQEKNLSYSTEIIQANPITPEQLNEIFNKCNEAFFKFENFTDKLDVQNPLDETY
jgi:hypothetical protein